MSRVNTALDIYIFPLTYLLTYLLTYFSLSSYGDKAPKSALGRLFAMVWILTGLVIMAIFMANITSALTSMSLEPTNKNINGKEVKDSI